MKKALTCSTLHLILLLALTLPASDLSLPFSLWHFPLLLILKWLLRATGKGMSSRKRIGFGPEYINIQKGEKRVVAGRYKIG